MNAPKNNTNFAASVLNDCIFRNGIENIKITKTIGIMANCIRKQNKFVP